MAVPFPYRYEGDQDILRTGLVGTSLKLDGRLRAALADRLSATHSVI